MKKFLIFLFLIVSQNLYSTEVEGFFGATYTSFADVDGYDTLGASARIKYNRYQSGKGLFIFSNFKGQSLFNFDALFGYGTRSQGQWFFEAGAGIWYSFYFGPGYGGLLSTGFELGEGWFVNIPIILRLGGLQFLQIAPMIGLRF